MKKKQISIYRAFAAPQMLLAASLAALLLFSCDGKESGQAQEFQFSKDASYALGMAFGQEIKNNVDSSGYIPDNNELMKGFKDVLEGKNTRLTFAEAMTFLEDAFTSMSQARADVLEKEENSFLAENSKKPGVIITPSGLQYEVIREGTGAKPSYDSVVRVHYTGTFLNGEIFDNSRQSGVPAEFEVSVVIPGWVEGIQLMSVGSNYIFYIPSNLAYGNGGISGFIPPYSTLIFDVELLDIIDMPN